jgi:hypothetical protein
MFNHAKRIDRTNILPLRWLANISGSIGSHMLMKAVYLDEDSNYGLRYRIYGNLWHIFHKPYEKWGTYYSLDVEAWTAELDSLMEDMDADDADLYEKLGDEYDKMGIDEAWSAWESELKDLDVTELVSEYEMYMEVEEPEDECECGGNCRCEEEE